MLLTKAPFREKPRKKKERKMKVLTLSHHIIPSFTDNARCKRMEVSHFSSRNCSEENFDRQRKVEICEQPYPSSSCLHVFILPHPTYSSLDSRIGISRGRGKRKERLKRRERPKKEYHTTWHPCETDRHTVVFAI